MAWFSVFGVFVDDQADGGWFLLHWRLMLLWVMSVWFEGICTVFKTPPIIIWTTGSQSGAVSISGFPINECNCGFPIWGTLVRILQAANFWLPFSEICSVEDSDTGGLSSITVRVEYLFAFQFWYFERFVKWLNLFLSSHGTIIRTILHLYLWNKHITYWTYSIYYKLSN